MRRMLPVPEPSCWPRALVLLTALLVAACSSPTAPTRTPTVNTPPPAPPAAPDPRPLSISCPPDQSAASSTGAPVAVGYPAPTVSGGVPPAGATAIAASCTPPSASMFPVGPTTVRCSASDATTTAACTFTVTVTAPQLRHTTFLAFGDSLTAGEITVPSFSPAADGSPNYRLILVPTASYPTQLLTLLRARYTAQAAGLRMVNAGKSGEWAADGMLRLPTVLSTNRPEVVMLLEGTNDLVALGMPGVARAARAIDTMAREIRGRGARAFIATIPPARPTGHLAIPAAQVDSLNTRIRAIAQGEGAVLVDLHTALSSDIPRYIGIDGLHPTEAGYQKIAETFFAAIRASLEVP